MRLGPAIDWARARRDLRDVLLGGRWRRANERVLVGAGLVLLLSGALHVALGLVFGWSFEGPISPRKPALFGLATGVTLVSLAWVDGLLRRGRGVGWLGPLLAASALAEVGIITLQFWRDEASHFNRSGGIDGALAWSIEGCAIVITLCIAAYLAWTFPLSFVDRDERWTGASPAMKLAVRFGLASLLAGCLFGLFMVSYGHRALEAGGSPRIYGQAGVLKFVHGTPLHAIQVMPLAVWALELGRLPRLTVWRSTVLGSSAYLALYALTVVQTFTGHARFDLVPLGTALLVLTGALLALALVVLITPLRPVTTHQG